MNKQEEKQQKGIVEPQGVGECKLADEQLGQIATSGGVKACDYAIRLIKKGKKYVAPKEDQSIDILS